MSERALTVLALTESGWMRRFRVPQRALVVLAALLIGLTLTAPFLTAFAVRAGAELSRLRPMERENQALTSQLRVQAALLGRLQSDMARLHELEKRLRTASGLADRRGTGAGTGQGEAPCQGEEVRKCCRSPS